MVGSKCWKLKKVENRKNLFLMMEKKRERKRERKKQFQVENHEKVERKMRKSVKSKENGD